MSKLKIILIFLLATLTASEQYINVPSVVVAGVGQDAVFRCSYLNAINIELLINGTSLSSLELSDVEQSFDQVGSLGSLRFRNVPVEYNGTIVQCRVNTTSGIIKAPNSTLLLQGTLSAVGALRVSSINDSSLFLNWTAPFTLDITTSSVDIMTTSVNITYCVDVVSSTSSATLHSECGITETEFTYPLPPRSWCDVYNFTVTPVNFIGNGTWSSISYEPQNLLIPNRIEGLTKLNTIYTIVMSAPICTASLWFMDLDDAEGVIHIGNANLTISGTNVTLTSQQLTPNRRYALNITAANIRGEGTATSSQDQILSTHDITECSTNSNLIGVEVYVRFVENSTATGALVSFIFMEDEEIDFSKSFVRAVDKDDLSHGHMIPIQNFSPGNYEAFFYDIESDGRIPNGVAYRANRGEFAVMSIHEPAASPASSNCSVSSLGGVISVSCPYSFQVTVQLSSIDVVANLKVHTGTDSDPATIPVQSNDMHLVTILKIGDNGIMSELPFSHMEMVTYVPTSQGPAALATETPGTPLAIIAVIGSVIIILALVVAVVVTLFVLKSRRKVARPTMFIAGEGIHRTCSISYHKKSGRTVFSTPVTYDTYSVDEDMEHEQDTEHDISQDTATTTPSLSSFACSNPDDFFCHVYSKVNIAKKTHTPTSTNVVSSPSTGSDSFILVARDIDVDRPSQASAELFVTEDEHYSTIDHGTTRPTEINLSCEDSTYSLPTKYKNAYGQEYSLVQVKSSNTADTKFLEIAKSINEVKYSKVQPSQNLLKGHQPACDQPTLSRQDETQVQDGNESGVPFRWQQDEEKIPLIDSAGVKAF